MKVLTLITFFLSLNAFATLYYIDASSGNDSNSGTELAPWQTLSKISQTTIQAGDQILLKKGEVWNERLNDTLSGSTASPIIIGAYGTGDLPLITYKFDISGTWQDLGNGIFKINMSSYCYVAFENGANFNQASSSSLTDGRWFFDGSSYCLYYKPLDGIPSNKLTYSSASYIIRFTNSSNIIIQDLEIAYGGGHGVLLVDAKNIQVKNCTVHHHRSNGIALEGSDADASEYCEIINNDISQCGNGIYTMNHGGKYHTFANNKISYCNYDEWYALDGIAIGLQNPYANSIYNNEIDHAINSISLWSPSTGSIENNIIRNNYIRDCKKTYSTISKGKAIAIVAESDGQSKGNSIYNNIIVRANFAIRLAYPGSSTLPNKIFNNTIVDCGYGLYLSNSDYLIFKNNILYNSDNSHIYQPVDDNCASLDFDNNCYYPDGDHKFRFESTYSTYANYASSFNSSFGGENVAVIADPSFISTTFTLAEDVKLDNDSPCINLGTIMELTEDYAYTTIVGSMDIGAYTDSTLIAEWLFSEGSGSAINDNIGDNDGLLAASPNTPTWAQNSYLGGYCLDFGGNDYIVVSDSEDVSITNNMTIAGWINIDENYSTKISIIGKYSCYKLQVKSDGYMNFSLAENSINYNFSGPNLNNYLGTWTHIAVTVNLDDGEIKFYINGANLSTATTNISSIDDNSNDLYIGVDSQYMTYPFEGMIDNLQIFNTALNSSKIFDNYATVSEWHFNEGTGNVIYDNTGKHNGSLTASPNTPTWAQNSYLGGYCLDFDGNDYIVVSDLEDVSITNNMTIAGWINIDENYSTKISVLGKYSCYKLQVKSDGYMNFSLAENSINYNFSGPNLNNYLGTWTHIAVTVNLDDGEIKFYINGANLSTATTNISSIDDNSNDLYIGADSQYMTYPFEGMIDEILLRRTALNDTAILTMYGNY